MEALRTTLLICVFKDFAGATSEYFQMPRIRHKNEIFLGDFVCLYVVLMWHTVIMRMLLSKLHYWITVTVRADNGGPALSQRCQLYGEEEGAGSRVARIRNMDMKGRKETVKWIIPPSQNLIILFYGRRVSPIGWKHPHWEVRTTRGDSFIIKWKVNLQRHCHDHQLFISRFKNIGARWPKSAALR